MGETPIRPIGNHGPLHWGEILVERSRLPWHCLGASRSEETMAEAEWVFGFAKPNDEPSLLRSQRAHRRKLSCALVIAGLCTVLSHVGIVSNYIAEREGGCFTWLMTCSWLSDLSAWRVPTLLARMRQSLMAFSAVDQKLKASPTNFPSCLIIFDLLNLLKRMAFAFWILHVAGCSGAERSAPSNSLAAASGCGMFMSFAAAARSIRAAWRELVEEKQRVSTLLQHLTKAPQCQQKLEILEIHQW